MSSRKITYIHLFIWLFAIFANLPYASLSTGMSTRIIVSNIIGFLYLMVVFYLFYLVMVPQFLNRKKLTDFFGFSFLVVLIMPFFGYTILFFARAIFDNNFENFYRGYTIKMHMSGYYPVLTAAVFGSFFSVIINWFTTMNQKAELDKQKISVELELLKSKINPHFLFNTLNNIDSLISRNPEGASAALIRLSDIMRYLTYEASSEVVELQKEAEYISNFIELHRIRFKSPEDIKFDVHGELTTKIAPALFVPLVENGFKFAGLRNGKPEIKIVLNSENGIIEFEITNYYDPGFGLQTNELSGYGLANLRKRLDLIYPGKFLLLIEPAGLLFRVKLTIDTNGN
jgi:two-component system, LytTR family, sensor kinase